MAQTKVADLYTTPTRVKMQKPAASTMHHAPAVNTAAVGVLHTTDLATDEAWVIKSIPFSYSAAPTGGSLTVSDGTLSFVLDITDAGPDEWIFDPPQKFGADLTVTCTLAAGGGSCAGKINLFNSWAEKAQ